MRMRGSRRSQSQNLRIFHLGLRLACLELTRYLASLQVLFTSVLTQTCAPPLAHAQTTETSAPTDLRVVPSQTLQHQRHHHHHSQQHDATTSTTTTDSASQQQLKNATITTEARTTSTTTPQREQHHNRQHHHRSPQHYHINSSLIHHHQGAEAAANQIQPLQGWWQGGDGCGWLCWLSLWWLVVAEWRQRGQCWRWVHAPHTHTADGQNYD